MSRLVKKPDSSGPHAKPSAVPQEGAPRNHANISGTGSLPAARASLETLREQVQRLEALTLPENMDSRSDQLMAQAATLAIAAQQQATHALLSGAVEANIRAHQRPSPPPPRSSLSQQDSGSSSTGPPSSFVRRQSMTSSLNNNPPTTTTTSTKGPAGEAVGGVTPPRPSPGHRVVATSTSSSSSSSAMHHLQPTTPPPRTHHGANTTTTATTSSSSSAKWLAAVMQDGWSADEAVAGLAATGEVSARAAIAWLNEHRRAGGGGDGRGLPAEPATLSSSSSSATKTATGASGSTASSSATHHTLTTTITRPLPSSVAGVAAGAGVRAVRATTPPVDLSSTNHGTPPDRSQPQQHPPNATPCRLQVRDPKGKVHSLEPLTPNNPFLGSTTLYEAVHAFYTRQQSQPQPTKQSTASSTAVVGNNAVVPTGVVVVVPWKQERYAVAAMRKVTLDDAGMCPSGTITLMF